MPINQEAILYTLTGFADVFYDFFLGEPKDVTFKYMDQNGDIKTITVANIEKAKQNLEKSAVTDDELAKTLKDYYKKVEVDEIRNAILKKFDDYYKKSEIDSKVTAIKNDYANKINATKSAVEKEVTATNNKLAATKSELEGKITVVDNRTVMTEAEYQALAEARRKMYAGSGISENSPQSRSDQTRFINKDLWTTRHELLGNGDSNNLVMLGNTVFNVNGNRIIIRNINPLNLSSWNNTTDIGNDITHSHAIIYLPEAPTAKAIITDSTTLPADMKQGDFAILKDLDKNLVPHVSSSDDLIANWTTNGKSERTVVTKIDDKIVKVQNESGETNGYLKTNIEGKDNKVVLIPGVKYEISFTIKDANVDLKFGTWSTGPSAFKAVVGENKLVYTPNRYEDRLHIYIAGGDDDSYYEIDVTTISIKQAEEQPIVALQNVDHHVDVYQNVTMFEGRESISRQDLVFLEVWDENIDSKNLVYPFGNIQYQGGDVDGVSGITKGTFEGADAYSLFGNWQEPGDLVGMGYVWDKLSEEDKINLASNPDNNIRRKGDTWLQTRYRVRVVKGLGNDWFSYGNTFNWSLAYNYGDNNKRIVAKNKLSTIDTDIKALSDSEAFAPNYKNALGTWVCRQDLSNMVIPIALVQRRNDGVYNKIFNPVGSAQAYDKDNDKLLEFGEYALDDNFITSLEDCFNVSKIAAKTKDGNVVPADDSSAEYRSGYIMSGMSGHEAGLYADEINERDVEDLRMYAEKKPYNEILDEYLQKAVSGKIRGKENSENIKIINLVGNNDCSGNDYNYFLDDGSDNFLPRLLNIPYGTGTYYLARKGIKNAIAINNENGEVGYIQHIWYNQDRSYFGFHLSDFNVPNRVTSLPHKPIHAKAGDKYTIMLIFNKDYIQNNIMTQTDIIGDPRKLKDGFQGNPLVVGEEGESLLPNKLSWYNSNCVKVKLSRKNINQDRFIRLLVRNKNGNFVNYEYGSADLKFKANINKYSNELVFNVKQSYSDLGYASTDEMLNLTQIVVIYDTYANFLEIADNSEMLELKNESFRFGYFNVDNGTLLSQNLIKKVGTDTTGNARLYGQSSSLLNYRKSFYDGKLYTNWGYIENAKIPNLSAPTNNSPAVKVIPYLTQSSNRAYLQFVFKEMKFSSDPKLTIKPGIYLNNEYLGGERRSYTVAHFDIAGKLLGLENFDVYGSSNEAVRLKNYLNNIAVNNIVAISTYDEPAGHVRDNKDLKAFMAKCGANTDVLTNLEYRSSYALIGIKTGRAQGTKLIESYSPRYRDPVRIEYKTDDFIIRVESKGSNSSTTLDKSASWGDDNKFQITDKVSTVTDLNGEKVLIGQKRVALPYFITD